MLACSLWLAGCGLGIQAAVPSTPARDARFGRLGGRGPAPDARAVCRDWRLVSRRDPYATRHDSFPEAAPEVSCFTHVHHDRRGVRIGPIPRGCGVPDGRGVRAMQSLARVLESGQAPVLASSRLSAADRARVERHNATALRRTAARVGRGKLRRYPYSAIVVPGYGNSAQHELALARWRPGDACLALERDDFEALGPVVDRLVRAAQALRAGVAPLVIVSGGTRHSRMVEAFAMLHVLTCLLPVRPDEVLLEPEARHTHENLREAGRWLVAMGGRTAYLVTDDGLQDDYFQEWSGFELVGGSIDQRSLRDWGSLVGSWRQASTGIRAGFWFTPFRFWAEPRVGVGGLHCPSLANRPLSFERE